MYRLDKSDPTTDHGVYRCECVTDEHEKPHTYVLPTSGESTDHV